MRSGDTVARHRAAAAVERRRQLVLGRFSLRQAARLQEAEYLAAIEQRVTPVATMADAARSGTSLVAMKLRNKYQRWRGTGATEDSNGLAVIAKVLAAGRA